MDEISRCRFGVFYFSEPQHEANSSCTFVDNPNVLFEAGMIHALTNSEVAAGPETWIPIREKGSSSAPFDFAAERIIEVKRTSKGQLIKEDLETQLSERLDVLIASYN